MIIIVRNFGQLGNRLLLSAHLIAAAREYGALLVNPSFAEYAEYFPATANDLWCRYPSRSVELGDDGTGATNAPSPWLRYLTYRTIYYSGKALWFGQRLGLPIPLIRLGKNESCDLSSPSFQRLATGKLPLLVSGWQFRSESLLHKHADAIRKHFQIAPKHRERVDDLIHRIRQHGQPLIGIHIRQGDYAKFQGGKWFYRVSDYVATMRRIRDAIGHSQVGFLVCSDAKLDPAQFGDLTVHFGTGHLVEDMYALAETDLLVGPPSTFTGWASFYGNVPVQFMETADQPIDVTALQPKQAA